jgi:hypothetical protein
VRSCYKEGMHPLHHSVYLCHIPFHCQNFHHHMSSIIVAIPKPHLNLLSDVPNGRFSSSHAVCLSITISQVVYSRWQSGLPFLETSEIDEGPNHKLHHGFHVCLQKKWVTLLSFMSSLRYIWPLLYFHVVYGSLGAHPLWC